MHLIPNDYPSKRDSSECFPNLAAKLARERVSQLPLVDLHPDHVGSTDVHVHRCSDQRLVTILMEGHIGCVTASVHESVGGE